MSKRFAVGGAKVIGLDKNPQVINFKNFNFKNLDILNFKFESYNLIICSLILHSFKKEIAFDILQNMKRSTIKEGYNLIISKSEKDKSLKEDRFYPSLEELLKIYKGWKIKYLQDFTEEEDHGNGSHKHNLIFFLAKND